MMLLAHAVSCTYTVHVHTHLSTCPKQDLIACVISQHVHLQPMTFSLAAQHERIDTSAHLPCSPTAQHSASSQPWSASKNGEEIADFQRSILKQISAMHSVLHFVQPKLGPDGVGSEHACNFWVCRACQFPHSFNWVGSISICQLHSYKWTCTANLN